MFIAPLTKAGGIFLIEFHPEFASRTAQKIEKLNAREAKRPGCLAGRQPIIGIELECGLLIQMRFWRQMKESAGLRTTALAIWHAVALSFAAVCGAHNGNSRRQGPAEAVGVVTSVALDPYPVRYWSCAARPHSFIYRRKSAPVTPNPCSTGLRRPSTAC